MEAVDTRHKIFPGPVAVEIVRNVRQRGERCRLLIACFDPMLAEQAARVREARRKADRLMVLIRKGEQPLLPLPARAELAAGLAAVDYVVMPDESEAELIAEFQKEDVVTMVEADRASTLELMRRVHGRSEN